MTEDKQYAVDRWHFVGQARVSVSRSKASTLDEALERAERLASLPGTTRVKVSRRDPRGRYSAVRVWVLRRSHAGADSPLDPLSPAPPFAGPPLSIPSPGGGIPGSHRSGEEKWLRKTA